MNSRKFVQIGVLILFAGLLLVSCKTADTAAPTATMIETTPPENTPVPATPTAIPRTLTICLGQEPDHPLSLRWIWQKYVECP